MVDPYNFPSTLLQAEQAMLGAILADNARYKQVAAIIQGSMLMDPVHQHIFATITRQISAGMNADVATVNADLGPSGLLDEVGGTAYTAELVEKRSDTGLVADFRDPECSRGEDTIDTMACKALVAQGNEEEALDDDGCVMTPIGRIWMLLPGATLDGVPSVEQQAARAVLRCGQAVLLLAPDEQTEEAVREALLTMTAADEESGERFGHA